ncbi:MAG: hypothetical protein ACT4PL_14655 [Phycisphaerales bacterium]
MADRAKVNSVDALKDYRQAVAVFVQEVSNALAEIDADMQRAVGWLRFEMLPRWRKELQTRQEQVIAARTERSRKELLSMADMPSLVEERKKLDQAKRRVSEAEQKIENVKKWARAIDREVMLAKGQSQSIADAVGRDLPAAILRLTRMIDALEKYAQIAPPASPGRPGPGGAVEEQAEAQARARAQSWAAAWTTSAGGGRGESTSPGGSGALLAALRRRTPSAAARGAVEFETQPGFLPARGPVLPEGGLLLRLGVAGERADPAGRVVLALGALGGGDYYVERMLDDGSWFIGNAGPGDGGRLEALPAAALLASRPDLREVLELPRGSIALVVAGVVSSAAGPGIGAAGGEGSEGVDL